MALINCPECGKKISDTAPSCPHCGYLIRIFKGEGEPVQEKRKSDINVQGWVIIAVIILVLGLGGRYCLGTSGKRSSGTYKSTSTEKKWYDGGTLHKATIAEWKKATYKNKLATCGDFAAVTDNTVSMDEVKRRAENLVSCIDETVKGSTDLDSWKVSEVATLCVVSLGYNKD